jgi:hypothetical protein
MAVDWGKCNMTNEEISEEREFKLYLDPTYRDDSEGCPSHAEAVKYYKDYMRALHNHLEQVFQQRVWEWSQCLVEYRFSIPTTWKSARLTSQLKGWLAEAGFADTPSRRVVISQTEAEAAAVYAAKNYDVCYTSIEVHVICH